MLKKIRHTLSTAFILMGACLLVWGLLPSRRQIVQQYLEPSIMQVPSNALAEIPAILEVRQVELEWPTSMRIGDTATITLNFRPVGSEIILPTAQESYADAYERYNLMAESRFEVAGVTLDPGNPVRESLLPGQAIRLKWQVSTWQPGTYTGKAWLSLRFLPLNGDQPTEVPIFIQELDLRATSLLGVSGPIARLVGSLGIVISFALGYDVVISIIHKLNIRHRTKNQMNVNH